MILEKKRKNEFAFSSCFAFLAMPFDLYDIVIGAASLFPYLIQKLNLRKKITFDRNCF